LTSAEEHDRSNVFDIALLGRRLSDTTRWLRTEPVIGSAPIGYFGASTGAAAALWAATEPDAHIAAVVSRGAVRTWPALDWGRSPRRRCSSSAATTTSSST
jgi:putative phosphoribosyl transferase